ncbi:hypothetical protein BDZ89DRAFT_684078 [Hymenopellis radicata]|nr:hypothetical protein BDZ89DRAFT_684078 [Hymenopellis radicata]
MSYSRMRHLFLTRSRRECLFEVTRGFLPTMITNHYAHCCPYSRCCCCGPFSYSGDSFHCQSRLRAR